MYVCAGGGRGRVVAGTRRHGQVAGLTVSVDRPTRMCENVGAENVPRFDMRGSEVATTCEPNVLAASARSTSCLRTEPTIQDMSAKTHAKVWIRSELGVQCCGFDTKLIILREWPATIASYIKLPAPLLCLVLYWNAGLTVSMQGCRQHTSEDWIVWPPE